MWQLSKLEKRLGGGDVQALEALQSSALSGNGKRSVRLQAIKGSVHQRLLERLDMAQLETLQDDRVAEEIRAALLQLFEEVNEPLDTDEKQSMAQELEFEILGLGPLEPLLQDPSISDILVNRFDQVYIERRGKLERTDIRFWQLIVFKR